jgi:hypothetical protein
MSSLLNKTSLTLDFLGQPTYPSLITLEKENLETFNHVDEMPILEMQENDWMRSCGHLEQKIHLR